MAKFSDFISEYKTAQEPSKQEKARNWDIAIGLQQVDGLTPSRYLYQVARDNIEGKLSHDEVHQSLRQYYRTPEGDELGIEYWEADTVSNRIAELLSNSSFTFAPLLCCLFTSIYLMRHCLNTGLGMSVPRILSRQKTC